MAAQAVPEIIPVIQTHLVEVELLAILAVAVRVKEWIV
jgi:hypothetical protein